ncbi:ATP synthase F0 subunit A [Streptomyces sp. Ru73]|uniref:F0F1 ATP synthase subunit A n=1 Tax=Streptomyces sp. Ru73 TaxID=2080748 RepID=UPI000CDE01A2|nr:F0F1 ATP synthase subunit A [Streptomyces sp. Ru73]POX41203.1 ATP synthase F0 subunit A [Streptomyces sp. Ru73]
MSADLNTLAFNTECHLFIPGCGFEAPGLHSFVFDPLFSIGSFNFNKPMLLALLSTVVVVWFFWAAFARAKVVPGKLQMIGEAGYDFVRRGLVYDALGKKEGEKYVPFMVALFFFVWIMNIWSIIPVAQFPVTSVIAFPAGLALLVWLLWVGLTFKKHGFVGAFKNFTGYDKSLGWVLPLLMIIELLSNLIIRPFTHAVRLFANMFAGHMLIVMFTIATFYLANGVGFAYAGASFVMTIVMTAFEVFIQAVQAYVFVLLACNYVQGALAEHH